MPEIKQEAKTYVIHYQCDKCGKGFMQYIQKQRKAIDDKGVMCAHQCSHCKTIVEFKNQAYPATIVESEPVKLIKKAEGN